MTEQDPERALALSYAVPEARAGLFALFALDDTLAQILRTTREPLVGQMRLTWWYEALCALDGAPPPAQPVLQALMAEVLPRGVKGAALAGMIDGWEALLADPIDDADMMLHARGRGGVLFEAAGAVLGIAAQDPAAAAGEAWALADLSRHLRDRQAASRAVTLANAAMPAVRARRWSRAGRPLGALATIARMDLALPLDRPILRGSPGRVARLALHRLTGR